MLRSEVQTSMACMRAHRVLVIVRCTGCDITARVNRCCSQRWCFSGHLQQQERVPWQRRCAARAYMRQSAASTSAVQQRWLPQAYQPMRGSWYIQCQQLVDVAESVINNSQPLVEDYGHVRAAVEVQAYRVSPKVVGASQSVWHIRGDGTVVGEGCMPCGAGRISPCSLCADTRPLRRRTRIFVANQRSVHLHSTTIPAVIGRTFTARDTTPTRTPADVRVCTPL